VHPKIATAAFTKGVDKGQKEELDKALAKLNKEAFDAIYSVLEIKSAVEAPAATKTSSKKD
jgi:hypothetical protein